MSDTQHSNDDSLYQLFLQLHQPATGANFEREVMQKIRIAARKKRESRMWEVKSTLLAASAAAVLAVAAWMAMTTLGEQPPLFEAAVQQLTYRCNAGLLLLCEALYKKEAAYLMMGVVFAVIIAYLSNQKGLSAWDF
ncbi:MAG: hypothetical protein LBB79_10125 [Prevotellaceae bacterium]|jgi:hypothetical protein|nr:hypothetical protein [Prevotellaceae bacterium]